MPKLIDVDFYLNECMNIPLVDVRSPKEFLQGHIPGAVNIPLFSDSERETVGILYKKSGNFKAVLKGLDIVGPKMSAFAEEAKKISSGNQLVVHCWRGGMRSSSMAWLFETVGISCMVVKGGYKSYRTSFRNLIKRDLKLRVLGGMTGSGKSEILREIKNLGQQVIDLETLANHKGSAFGGIGQGNQPTTEQFENNLFAQIREFNPDETIWLEDESKTIGSVHIPDEIYNKMRESLVIQIQVPLKGRIKRLVHEYAEFPKQELIYSLERIKKRFGNQHFQPAYEAIQSGDFETAAALILEYYDKSYLYGLSKRNPASIAKLTLKNIDPMQNAKEVLLYAQNLTSIS